MIKNIKNFSGPGFVVSVFYILDDSVVSDRTTFILPGTKGSIQNSV